MFGIRMFPSVLRSIPLAKILTLLMALLLTVGFIAIPTSKVQAISCSQFYTVQVGDDLYRIAARYGVTWQYLAGINGIYYTNALQPGQTICVVSSDVPISPSYTTGAVTYPYYNNNYNYYNNNNYYNYPYNNTNYPYNNTNYPYNYSNRAVYYSYPYNNTYRNNYPYNTNYYRNYNYPYNNYYPSNCAQYYTVQYGDNLYRIGLAYGVSWTYLSSLNNLYNPNALYAGQSICVRSSSGYYPYYNYPY